MLGGGALLPQECRVSIQPLTSGIELLRSQQDNHLEVQKLSREERFSDFLNTYYRHLERISPLPSWEPALGRAQGTAEEFLGW